MSKPWSKKDDKRKRVIGNLPSMHGFAASTQPPPPTLAIAPPPQGTATRTFPEKKTNVTVSLMKFFSAVSTPHGDAPAIRAADGGDEIQLLVRLGSIQITPPSSETGIAPGRRNDGTRARPQVAQPRSPGPWLQDRRRSPMGSCGRIKRIRISPRHLRRSSATA